MVEDHNMNPLKVLHINCNYITTPLHQTMVEHLDAYNIENKVFVPVYDPNCSVIKLNDNVCVSQCFNKWDRVFFDYKQRKIYNQIQKEYDIKAFDCIHAYTLFTDGNCAMKLSQKYGIPYVVAVRDTDVNTFLKLRVNLHSRAVKILCGAKAIFFLSESYHGQVMEKYVPDESKEDLEKKSHIIPNGIDDFWLNNLANDLQPERLNRIQNKKVRLILVAHVTKRKNVATAIKAAELLIKDGWDVEFTVVGDILDSKSEEVIQKSLFTKHVPQCQKEQLIDIYRDNDIFVLPSFTETFGLVYAEAISQGLPVIYSKGQGFDSQFPEGVVGYHVDASSAESVAQGILAVAKDYESITRSLPEKAKKFSWGSICREYAEIYKDIEKERTVDYE